MASIVQQLSDALVLTLEAAEAAGAFARQIVTQREYDTNLELEDTDIISVMAIPMLWKRHRESNGTWMRDVRMEILVRKRFAGDIEAVDLDDYFALCEDVDNYLADPDNQVLTTMTTAEYIEPDEEDADREIVNKLGVLWLPKHLNQYRQFTGIVRVAYHVTQNY